VPLWRFHKRSSVRVACSESQSPPVQLRRNRKHGDEIGTLDRTIKKRRVSAALQNVAVIANINLPLAFCSLCRSDSSLYVISMLAHICDQKSKCCRARAASSAPARGALSIPCC